MTCIRRPHTVWTTCPCRDCRADSTRMAKLARSGRYHRAPSDAATDALTRWTIQGYSPAWIASAVGVHARYIEHALADMRAGRPRRIGPRRAAQILAADITTGTAGTRPAFGARRRLQALAVIGWTTHEMSTRTGVAETTIAAIQRGETATISATRHATVLALWSQLSGTPGPSSIARARAVRRGWAPPLAWDDPDDPLEVAWTPDGPAGARSHGGGVANVDSLTDCAAWGLTIAETAQRLGVTRDGVENGIARHAPHLRETFARNLTAKRDAA